MQVLLNLKWEQWKFAESSLDDKNGEIDNLKDQIKELEHENKDLQKAVSACGLDRGNIGEARRLEFAVVKLESELESLRIAKDVSFKEKEELMNEKRELERRIELISKENRELLERYEYLHIQLQDRSSLYGKSNEEASYRKEISSLRAKIRALEDEKQNLWNDVKRLESNLKQASLEIDRATDDYVRMKEALTEADRSHAEKTAECNLLRAQVASLSEKIDHPEEANDFIMNVVEQKIEEWKEDMEIVKLNKQLNEISQEVRDLKADSDKTSVRALVQTIKDRDGQIQSLKNQLTDATNEVEKSTALLKDFAKQADENEFGGNNRKADRIAVLKKQLQEKDNFNAELEKRLKHVEEAAYLQANEITVLEKQLKRYEEGEYGLSEAISELKATRLQLNSKERQLEEICRLASQAESSLNEINLENEHLRNKLGIPLNETIDLNGYRRQKRAKKEEECAVNIILQKERLELKRKLRNLAGQLGQQYGLSDSHVDGVLLGNLTQADEEVISARSAKAVSASISDLKDKHSAGENELVNLPEIWKARFKVLDGELAQAIMQIEEGHKKQDKLETRLKQITEANILLENGFKEIQKQIRSYAKSKDQVDMGKAGQQNEIINNLKSTDENVVLDCPSLDKLLAALDAKNIADDVDTGRYLKSRVDHLEGANQELRFHLRDTRLNSATNEVKLNQAYDRIKQLESQLKSLDTLDNDLKYAVCKHRQGLLYRDFYNEREAWKKEKEKLEQRIERSETRANDLEVHKTELIRLQDMLSSLDSSSDNKEQSENSSIKQKIADQSRQLLLLRVNEAGLLRRYAATQEREAALSKENTSLKSDLIQLESAVSARLNYYARYKEIAAFQIQKLQKSLDSCVTEDELNSLRNEYETLAIKYRELLERDSDSVSNQLALKSTQANLDALKKQHNELKEQLAIEKERRYLLESSGIQLQTNTTKHVQIEDDKSDMNIAKRLALVEMKELNEQAVPISIHRELETKNTELEQADLKLRHEIDQLKEVTLISMNQHQNLEDQQNNQMIEIKNLREQMSELESKDDSRANLARLHRLVTRMQVSWCFLFSLI
ncbi:unnamed protein product [Trichobilharzia regenti]|nr:unnamed protein product [Trichobilharzia regenti]